eukprot:s5065_g1.t1
MFMPAIVALSQAILLAVLQIQTVITLDISSQPLKKAGMEHLASFLRSDKKLQTLTAQNISTPSYYTADPRRKQWGWQQNGLEMLDFAKAMEVNSTLATLDLRGNALHGGIVGRLRRTMEEKRSVLPLPFDSKICFLMCNRRMPYHLQLPEVAQVCEVRPSETDMLWRPWMRNLATDLEGFVQGQGFRHIGVFESDEEDDDFPWDDLRAAARRFDSSGDEGVSVADFAAMARVAALFAVAAAANGVKFDVILYGAVAGLYFFML